MKIKPASQPFLAYIASLPQKFIEDSIWNGSVECSLAIYKLLLPLSQYTIQRLLPLDDKLPFAQIRGWLSTKEQEAGDGMGDDDGIAAKNLQNESLHQLKDLYILQGEGGLVWLNASFRKSLLSALATIKVPLNHHQYSKAHDDHVPDQSSTNNISNVHMDKWSQFLYTLVTSDAKIEQTHPRLCKLFQKASFIDAANKAIQHEGFHFLLAQRHHQLWTLIVQWVAGEDSVCDDNEAVVACLIERVCMIACAVVGDEWVAKSAKNKKLLAAQCELDEFLSLLGLLQSGRQENSQSRSTTRQSPSFKITRQTLHLHSPSTNANISSSSSNDFNDGFLIVETNFKIYAYTQNPLHTAILSLFTQINGHFPNMIHGQLTSPSIHAAINKGITAAQIICFLNDNLKTDTNVVDEVPGVVSDQIHLWEADLKRIKEASGVLYTQFTSNHEFEAIVHEAKRMGACLYVNLTRRLLVILSEHHQALKEFVKANF